jgi:hypothetical protein
MADAPHLPRSNALRILLAISRVARGRSDGLGLFGNTPQSFLASLAPQLAFPIVGGAMMLAGGGGLLVIRDLLSTLCLLLAPQVLSYELARLWRRDAAWFRFATAFNWCQWVLPALGLAVLLVLGVVMPNADPRVTAPVLIFTVGSYGLWLHWFVSRKALGLSIVRAILFVLGVNLGTVILLIVPRVLALHFA